MTDSCPMCGGEDEQGCYTNCPSKLADEVERMNAQIIALNTHIETQRAKIERLQAIRNDVLEEAAKVAEANSWRVDDPGAAAIRALKEKSST